MLNDPLLGICALFGNPSTATSQDREMIESRIFYAIIGILRAIGTTDFFFANGSPKRTLFMLEIVKRLSFFEYCDDELIDYSAPFEIYFSDDNPDQDDMKAFLEGFMNDYRSFTRTDDRGMSETIIAETVRSLLTGKGSSSTSEVLEQSLWDICTSANVLDIDTFFCLFLLNFCAERPNCAAAAIVLRFWMEKLLIIESGIALWKTFVDYLHFSSDGVVFRLAIALPLANKGSSQEFIESLLDRFPDRPLSVEEGFHLLLLIMLKLYPLLLLSILSRIVGSTSLCNQRYKRLYRES